jgi:hypothetical protein
MGETCLKNDGQRLMKTNLNEKRRLVVRGVQLVGDRDQLPSRLTAT